MRKFKTIAIVMAAFCAIIGVTAACATYKKLKPADKGYAETGKYRNYLKELGYSQKEIDDKIQTIFSTVFEAEDGSYHDVDVEVDGKIVKMGYVSDVKNNDVRTEGQSYGMMIAVQLDKPELFNKIWRWSKYYMRHNEEGPSHGLFAWSCRTNGRRTASGSASDGELYYVTTLLLASRRWGTFEEFNYLAEAQELLNDLFSKDGTGGVTNIINMEHKLINFCPDVRSNEWTDPSYHLPAFYEIWAETAQDGREDLYRELAANAREYLHRACDAETGINPDQSQFDGTPNRGSEFHYDSWRVPMNIAMDFTWYHKDAEWQTEYAKKFQKTILGRYGITEFPDQFALNGDVSARPMGGGRWRPNLRHSIGFVGTMATTALMCESEYNEELIRHMFSMEHKPYDDGYYDVYYDGLIYLFALLHLSGNYRMNW